MPSKPNAEYRRARSVLTRLRNYSDETVSAKAMLPSGMPRSDSAAFSALGRPEVIRDWKLTVQSSLREVGELGVAIMVGRLLGQQQSQANSFITIAGSKAVRQINGGQAMTPTSCEALFKFSLGIFIKQLDERGVPDDPFSERPINHVPPFIAVEAAHAVLLIADGVYRSVSAWERATAM
jgi:hypothetical protein